MTKRERVVARGVIAAPADQRESVIRAAMVDEAALARELVDEAIFPPVAYDPDPKELKRRLKALAMKSYIETQNGLLRSPPRRAGTDASPRLRPPVPLGAVRPRRRAVRRRR